MLLVVYIQGRQTRVTLEDPQTILGVAFELAQIGQSEAIVYSVPETLRPGEQLVREATPIVIRANPEIVAVRVDPSHSWWKERREPSPNTEVIDLADSIEEVYSEAALDPNLAGPDGLYPSPDTLELYLTAHEHNLYLAWAQTTPGWDTGRKLPVSFVRPVRLRAAN